MARYTATFAGNVRAYATVEIEAADDDTAHRRFQELAAMMADDSGTDEKDYPEEIADLVFNPQYDTLYEIEYLEDCGMDETPDRREEG